MSNASTTTEMTSTSFNLTVSDPGNRVRFTILLALQLMSVPCYLYVFYRFHQKRNLRQSIPQHVILLLLIMSFLFVTIALPITQAYMFTSQVRPASELFCAFWNWIHYSLNIINLFLMAFASIERNWLIFHPALTRSKRARIMLHYGPLVFCVAFPAIYYFVMIFLYRCVSIYDYTHLL